LVWLHDVFTQGKGIVLNDISLPVEMEQAVDRYVYTFIYYYQVERRTDSSSLEQLAEAQQQVAYSYCRHIVLAGGMVVESNCREHCEKMSSVYSHVERRLPSEAFNWESSLGVNALFDVGAELQGKRQNGDGCRPIFVAEKVFDMGFVICARGCETSIVSI
jgi:hypothetical protein